MRCLLSSVAIAALASVNAYGQVTVSEEEKEVDVIVITGELSNFGASKSATPILETARSISIETEEQFRIKGALTVDDTLNYISGVCWGDVWVLYPRRLLQSAGI